MRLNEYLQRKTESQDEYFDRTYWCDHGYDKKQVFEYASKEDKDHHKEPLKVITLQKAREYMDTLGFTAHRYHVPKPDETTPAQNELIKIEIEAIGKEPDGWKWINSSSGKIIHRLGKE